MSHRLSFVSVGLLEAVVLIFKIGGSYEALNYYYISNRGFCVSEQRFLKPTIVHLIGMAKRQSFVSSLKVHVLLS